MNNESPYNTENEGHTTDVTDKRLWKILFSTV